MSAQSPSRQAYRGAGARGMVGAPGLSGGAGGGLRGDPGPGPEGWGRGSGAAAACPAHSARGRAGEAGGCAGPRAAATIPPAALAAESRGCPGSGWGAGRSRLGTARRAALGPGGAGSAKGPRLGLRDAQPHSALRLRPFPSSLPPARIHFPPSSLLPFSLLPSPRLAATRSVYSRAGRGGAGRAPGWASSAPRWDPPGTRSRGLPGGSPSPSAGGGAKALGRVSLCFLSSRAPRGGSGGRSPLLWVPKLREGEQDGETQPWPSGFSQSRIAGRALAGGATEAPAGVIRGDGLDPEGRTCGAWRPWQCPLFPQQRFALSEDSRLDYVPLSFPFLISIRWRFSWS